ncbi:MAG: antitoxin [Acidimicrobiales bacterium]|nr:MAG: antitoxin [Acidimicrobiales bacterium]
MKISVSLPTEDITFVDVYGGQRDIPSRSSVIHHAIGLLRTVSMEDAYASAWEEWTAGEDAALWDTTSGDGITNAPR